MNAMMQKLYRYQAKCAQLNNANNCKNKAVQDKKKISKGKENKLYCSEQ